MGSTFFHTFFSHCSKFGFPIHEVFESKRVGSVAALLGDLLLGAATFRTHFQQSRFDMESVVEGTPS
jgi:hypothetical protein